MTNEAKELLLLLGDKYFKTPKGSWSKEEIDDIYLAHNAITGINKRDTGCGSCRRETIKFVYEQWKYITNI